MNNTIQPEIIFFRSPSCANSDSALAVDTQNGTKKKDFIRYLQGGRMRIVEIWDSDVSQRQESPSCAGRTLRPIYAFI